MRGDFERRSRLVTLAYTVLAGMALPPEGLSDKEVLLAMASACLKKAADTDPPRIEPPALMWRQGFGPPPED